MSIKFLQLNVEKKAHLENVSNFLKENDFDVCCFQEMYEEDAKFLSEQYGYFYVATSGKHKYGDSPVVFSKTPFACTIEEFLMGTDERYWNGEGGNFMLLDVDVEVSGVNYKILNTHLPVNYPGNVISEYQKDCYKKLKQVLDQRKEFLFLADTNSPRGTFIFDDLAKNYKDNIPQSLSSTLDPILHRAKDIEYVVDSVFSTKNYEVSGVQIHEGLSDHKGIIGTLTIKEN